MALPAIANRVDSTETEDKRIERTWKSSLIQQHWDGLKFPLETISLRTEFRSNVLNYIYRTALGFSDGALESAKISITSTPEEADSLALDLLLTVNADWDEIQAIEGQIFESISDWSRNWSQREIEDYSKRIYFGLIPSKL